MRPYASLAVLAFTAAGVLALFRGDDVEGILLFILGRLWMLEEA